MKTSLFRIKEDVGTDKRMYLIDVLGAKTGF